MIEHVPIGQDADRPRAGDIILCHRRGFVSWCIRLCTRGKVSHAALVDGRLPGEREAHLIEALTAGVTRTPLSRYRDTEYWLVRTGLRGRDQEQAVAFARSCQGDRYGFATDVGIALRFLPTGQWIGKSGTRICSALCAQAQVRGPVIYPFEPAVCSPQDLFKFYKGAPCPQSPRSAAT